MTRGKGHERLQDCVCSWVAEPVEVSYEHERVFEHVGLWDSRMTTAQYVRAIVHHINPHCTVHSWLLNPVGYVGQRLPKVSSIAVDAVPLANRPEPAEAEGYEVLVEDGGVVSRKMVSLEATGVPLETMALITGTNLGELKGHAERLKLRRMDGWEVCGGAEAVECMMEHDEHEIHPILQVKMGRKFNEEQLAERDQLIERARATWAEFKHEHADKMAWVMEYSKAMTTHDRERIKYDARKASEWYFVMAHSDGYGHCRSCHHECRFEHWTANDQSCFEPTCGHTAGCPGC